MGKFVLIYLAVVNLLTFGVYGWDKRRAAKGQRRISERELLLWAVAGGSIGAFFAMRRFRHKTRKKSFRLAFWAIVALQIVGIWFLVWR